MSSTGVVLQPPIKTNHPNHKSQMKNTNNNTNNNHNNSNNNSSTNGNMTKRKSKHDRNGRKRSKSFSGCNINKMLCQKSVPPTKFLLGGNITDPLNLNSLQNEEINRAMNAITPKSSPIPTPPRRKGQIEVIIPPNIHDPLNLIDCADDAEYEQQLYSPIKRGRKKRLKKRRTVSACLENLDSVDSILPISIAKTPETSTDSAKIPDEIPSIIISKIDNIKRDLNLDLSPKKRKFEANEYCANDGGGGGDITCINNTDNENKSTTIETTPPPITTLISTNTTTITCNITTATTTITTTTSTAPSITTSSTNSVKKFKHSMDKIVSPVVPQPGAWLKRSTSTSKPKPRRNKMVNEKLPVFKEKDKQFQYGNYNRYYGYRNAHIDIDHRLRIFSQHRYLFEGKDILDIGCNIGHITLSVARDFGAKSVTGIDIDPKLIAIARKNVKHYVKNTPSPKTGDDVNNQDDGNNKDKSSEFFPISMPILYGPIDIPGFNDNYTRRDFPNNVIFKKCNYILEDDALLALEQPQYDAILCLSITKWIHLNWGDVGLKQAFRRMYAQLRPGGKLILEPQNWSSYKSKRKLTETIYKNYNSIEFFPDKFTEYLLSSVVGFAKSEILGYPNHNAKGFRRPIQIFTKSTMFLSERIEASATPNINLSTHYDVEMKTEKYESQTQIELEKSEHIYYTNILNRYCGNQDDNDAVNEMIGEDLKHCADNHDCGDDNKNNSDLCDNGILQMDTSQQIDDNT